jgi:nicotinate-nucleotide adenylyltransferase
VNRPLGLFGGSFDPVHNAHLRLASEALASLQLGSIRWIPNGVPGHRETPRASAADRLAMLRLATAEEPRFIIDESELWQSEPTYSINTLTRLRGKLGATVPMVFIIGADHLLGLHLWRDWERLLDLTHFAIAARPGHEIRESAMTAAVAGQYAARRAPAASLALQPGGSMVEFSITPMEISSNAIRSAVAGGHPIADLLPAAVLDYIESKHLYWAKP